MCCALRQLPVIDFMSDHRFSIMSNRGSSSPQWRREDFPIQTALPSREPSRAEVELSQHILSHSQQRNNQQQANDQTTKDSPSPSYELRSPGSTSPSAERMRQITPRSSSVERNQIEQYQAFSTASSQADAGPTGQVCR